MWAQLIKARIKADKEADLQRFGQEMEAQAQASNTGPQRVIVFHNQKDPREHYTIIFFESEEKAREDERASGADERVKRFGELFEGQPEFVDLIPVHEYSR